MQIKSITGKKAVLGEAVTLFFATIIIVVILLIFALVSGAVKLFSSNSAGTAVDKEEKVGLQNPERDSSYFSQFSEFAAARASYNSTSGNVYEIMKEVGRG